MPPSQRRAYAKIERSLHEEVAWRLAALKPRCIWLSPPNGFWAIARSEEEKTLAARIVSQMKKSGMLQPGVPDWIFLWSDGSGAIELKRPAEKTLLWKTPAGRLSPAQKSFREQCEAAGVPYRVCSYWSEVETALREWGRI